jgi:hypothetical protein
MDAVDAQGVEQRLPVGGGLGQAGPVGLEPGQLVPGPSHHEALEVGELCRPGRVVTGDVVAADDEDVEVGLGARFAACGRPEQGGVDRGNRPFPDLLAEPGVDQTLGGCAEIAEATST